jgi:hypothetical protein
MRSILGALAIAGALGAAGPAMADEWTVVTTSETGSTHYYRSASVKRSGNIVRAWSREDARDADVEEDYPLVSDSLEDFDCATPRSRLVEIIDRDDRFEEVQRYDFTGESDWTDITPETVAAAKRAAFCK